MHDFNDQDQFHSDTDPEEDEGDEGDEGDPFLEEDTVSHDVSIGDFKRGSDEEELLTAIDQLSLIQRVIAVEDDKSDITTFPSVPTEENIKDWFLKSKLSFRLTIKTVAQNWMRCGLTNRQLPIILGQTYGLRPKYFTVILNLLFQGSYEPDHIPKVQGILIRLNMNFTDELNELGTIANMGTVGSLQTIVSGILTTTMESVFSENSFMYSTIDYIFRLLANQEAKEIFAELGGLSLISELMSHLKGMKGVIRLREAVADYQSFKIGQRGSTPVMWRRFVGFNHQLYNSHLRREQNRTPYCRYFIDYLADPREVPCTITFNSTSFFNGTAIVNLKVRHPLLPSEALMYNVFSCRFTLPNYVSQQNFFFLLQVKQDTTVPVLRIGEREIAVGTEASIFLDGWDIVFVQSVTVSIQIPTMYNRLLRFAIPVQLSGTTIAVGLASGMITPLKVYAMLERSILLFRPPQDGTIAYPVIHLNLDILYLDQTFSSVRIFFLAMLAVAAKDSNDPACNIFLKRMRDISGAYLWMDEKEETIDPIEKFRPLYSKASGSSSADSVRALSLTYYHVVTVVRYFNIHGKVLKGKGGPTPALSDLSTTPKTVNFLYTYFSDKENVSQYFSNYILMDNIGTDISLRAAGLLDFS